MKHKVPSMRNVSFRQSDVGATVYPDLSGRNLLSTITDKILIPQIECRIIIWSKK